MGEDAERDCGDRQGQHQSAEQHRTGRRCQPEGKTAARDLPCHRRLPAGRLSHPHETQRYAQIVP
jgi:hypothetical protein